MNKKNHKCYKLTYHLILVSKYRKIVFDNENLINDMKEKMIEISKDFNVEIINQNTDKDHIHLLIETDPKIDLTKYINILKGHSSRYIRKKYENYLKNKLYGDSFWSDSYYIATTGNVSLNKLIEYVNNQEKS